MSIQDNEKLVMHVQRPTPREIKDGQEIMKDYERMKARGMTYLGFKLRFEQAPHIYNSALFGMAIVENMQKKGMH